MTLDELRTIALGLPEATEEPHFDATSFRVRGRIFVTAPPDGDHANVFVAEDEVRASVAESPDWCREVWWGKKLAGVQVVLAAAPTAGVAELVTEAWRRKAPNRVVAALDASRS